MFARPDAQLLGPSPSARPEMAVGIVFGFNFEQVEFLHPPGQSQQFGQATCGLNTHGSCVVVAQTLHVIPYPLIMVHGREIT